MANLKRGLTTSSVKILWGNLEIIGDETSALFPTTSETSFEIPSSNLFENEITGDSWGARTIRKISKSDRSFTIQISGSSQEDSIKTLLEEFKKGTDNPLQIISILPESMGEILVRYDNAMLKSSPRQVKLSNDYPTYEIPFTVGFDSSFTRS